MYFSPMFEFSGKRNARFVDYLLEFDSLKVTHWLTPEKCRQKRTDPTITHTKQYWPLNRWISVFFFTFCLILVVSNDWLDRWINLVFCRLLTSAQKHTLCAKRNHSTNLWFSQWFAHNPHRFGAFSYFHTLNECTTAVYISFNCVGEKAIFRPYFISFRMVCWYFLYRI